MWVSWSNPGDARSELVEGGLFVAVDFENLIEAGDAEDFEEVGMNAAELELAFDRTGFSFEVDQLAERGARKVLNVSEIEEQIPVTFILDQTVELVADFLDVFFGDDFRLDKADNGHSVNVFEAEVTARTLGHRGYAPD
jgi:hypothetical protein